MSLSVTAEPVPFAVGSDGVARVGGTRVTLDTIVRAYKAGNSPEEIAASYSALKPADVYAVVAYYLRHEEDVEAYLSARGRQAAEVHELIESRSDRNEIRERLRARRLAQRNSSG